MRVPTTKDYIRVYTSDNRTLVSWWTRLCAGGGRRRCGRHRLQVLVGEGWREARAESWRQVIAYGVALHLYFSLEQELSIVVRKHVYLLSEVFMCLVWCAVSFGS